MSNIQLSNYYNKRYTLEDFYYYKSLWEEFFYLVVVCWNTLHFFEYIYVFRIFIILKYMILKAWNILIMLIMEWLVKSRNISNNNTNIKIWYK